MKRIVNTDNYGGDYPDEKFVLFPMRKETARLIADALNAEMGMITTRHYKVVDMDYILHPGFEP